MASLIHFNRWRSSPPPLCSHASKVWLTQPGALTAGLRALGTFSLKVVSEDIETPVPEDTWFKPDQLTWRREVLMSINKTPCVLARSVTTLPASHGTWQGIRRLGRRPLADILYNDPGIVRSHFEISRVGRAHGLYQTIKRARPLLGGQWYEVASKPTLLARRSVFWRNEHPLMVSECFLPDFWELVSCGVQRTLNPS